MKITDKNCTLKGSKANYLYFIILFSQTTENLFDSHLFDTFYPKNKFLSSK